MPSDAHLLSLAHHTEEMTLDECSAAAQLSWCWILPPHPPSLHPSLPPSISPSPDACVHQGLRACTQTTHLRRRTVINYMFWQMCVSLFADAPRKQIHHTLRCEAPQDSPRKMVVVLSCFAYLFFLFVACVNIT